MPNPLLLLLLVLTAGALTGEEPTAATAKGTILVVVASYRFSTEEYQVIRGGLEKAHYTVVVASAGKKAVGIPEFKLDADVTLDDVKDLDAYLGIVFCGGPGMSEFMEITNPSPQLPEQARTAHNERRAKLHAAVSPLLDAAVRSEKIIGAICLAPATVLAPEPLLKGRKVTGWAGKDELAAFKKAGATYTGRNVEIDGNLITAKVEGEKPFAQALVTAFDQALKKQAVAGKAH